jgi:hypothetical protein
VARARDAVDAVADAGAGDATCDVVGLDNASSRRITRDSITPDPPQHSRSIASAPKMCTVAGVRALGASSTTRRRDRKSRRRRPCVARRRPRCARRALLTRLVAAVCAAVGTTGTARKVHLSIKSFVSSRLVRLALWLSLSRLSRRRLRVRRIPSQPRFGACARPMGRRSRAPT